MKDSLKILWFSDIHFRIIGGCDCKSYFTDTDNGELFIESLIKSIREEHEIKPFDYFIITGDLAFSGSVKEYEGLNTVLISKLASILTNTHFISCCGNHDLSWGYEKDLWEKVFKEDNKIDKEKNVDKIIKFENVFAKKNEIFKSYRLDFEKLFGNYSSKVKDIASQFTANKSLEYFEASGSMSEKHLFGFVKDKKNKVLFLVLNTAWYSFGGEIDTTIKDIVDMGGNKTQNILKLKGVSAEQGNQFIGASYFEEIDFDDDSSDTEIPKISISNNDNIKALEKEFAEYRIINLQHHSDAWLAWQEKYSIDAHTQTFYKKYVETFADITLSGHEHLPVRTKARPVGNSLPINRWEFKASMLLPDEVKDRVSTGGADNLNFPDSCFSVLELTSDTITEKRYQYQFSDASWTAKFNTETYPLKYKKRVVPSIKDFQKEVLKVTEDQLIKYFAKPEQDGILIKNANIFKASTKLSPISTLNSEDVNSRNILIMNCKANFETPEFIKRVNDFSGQGTILQIIHFDIFYFEDKEDKTEEKGIEIEQNLDDEFNLFKLRKGLSNKKIINTLFSWEILSEILNK